MQAQNSFRLVVTKFHINYMANLKTNNTSIDLLRSYFQSFQQVFA